VDNAQVATAAPSRRGSVPTQEVRMSVHRLSSTIGRIFEQDEPLWRFFIDSAYVRHDPNDPETADFVAGNPQEMVLPEFLEAMQRWSVPKDPHWYAYKFNEPYAREAVVEALRDRRGIEYRPEDVYLTDGAFAGLLLTIRLVTDPGDEVVFVSPPWFFYRALILGAGAVPVRVRCDPVTWDLDVDAIAASITERTKAIIVNSPNNPTGKIYPPETLQRLADVLEEAAERVGHPIYLISDESYSRIVFDDRPFHSPTEFHPYSFLVYTFGKTLLTPGQRMGYVVIPPEMPEPDEVRTALMLGQMAFGGNGVPNAVLQRGFADFERMSIDVKHLQERRDRMVDGLGDAGYDVHSPEGTFYLLPRSPHPDDAAFVERLAAEKVFVLPGGVVEMPGYFRISLTGNDEMTERALPIFARLAQG
jgi:aspartate aminotransferase